MSAFYISQIVTSLRKMLVTFSGLHTLFKRNVVMCYLKAYLIFSLCRFPFCFLFRVFKYIFVFRLGSQTSRNFPRWTHRAIHKRPSTPHHGTGWRKTVRSNRSKNGWFTFNGGKSLIKIFQYLDGSVSDFWKFVVTAVSPTVERG